jgi:hypothetical protein
MHKFASIEQCPRHGQCSVLPSRMDFKRRNNKERQFTSVLLVLGQNSTTLPERSLKR